MASTEAAAAVVAEPDYIHTRKGLWSWLTTTDHKRIGIMYLIAIVFFFIVGMTMGVLIRLELLSPGAKLMSPAVYNRVLTIHGVVMIFLFIIPSIPAVFGNFLLPIMIGANDVSFPRLNLASWYLYMIGALLALISVALGGPDTGWTFYVPYSTVTEGRVFLPIVAVFILGWSSILTGLNFITTVHRLRAPGMKWFRMPLFVWSVYATSWIQVLATPVVGITLVLILMERFVGIGIFNPAKGGDPILYQHLFWIYSHPAVYIMILPGMGVVSEIVPVFSRKPIFGYRFIAYSSVSLALLSFLVWGHHMFVSGQSRLANMVFSALTFTVGIPAAIKVFNWVSTLYKGDIRLKTPMVYALAFLLIFTIGGLTGLFLGILSVDVHLHDTYFVVAHFHYVMMGSTLVAFLAALHHWWPKFTGRMYTESVARACAIAVFFGFNLTFLPQFVMGSKGMPRRYWDYDPYYQIYHQLSSIGAFVLGIAMFISIINLMASLKNGKRAPRNPWGGSSLEWSAPTPPPLFNFEKPPVLHEIYNYDDLVEVEEDVWERRAPLDVEPSEAPGDAHAHAKPEVDTKTADAAAEKAAASKAAASKAAEEKAAEIKAAEAKVADETAAASNAAEAKAAAAKAEEKAAEAKAEAKTADAKAAEAKATEDKAEATKATEDTTEAKTADEKAADAKAAAKASEANFEAKAAEAKAAAAKATAESEASSVDEASKKKEGES